MSDRPAEGLLEVLQRVPDPRGRKGTRHPLSAMLAAVVCATLCGFRGVQPTRTWLMIHGPAMWHLLGFGRCPPVRQTYVNVLAELDPELLESLLLAFVEQCLPDEAMAASSPNSAVSSGAVASLRASNNAAPTDVEIGDGKTLRGTRKREERAEQVLVRMDRTLGKIVASHAIPANTNETVVALELVKSLIRKGTLIIADAIYCQRDICQAVVDQGGDYLFTVKGNQPQLLRDIQQALAIPEGFSPLPSTAIA